MIYPASLAKALENKFVLVIRWSFQQKKYNYIIFVRWL